jgi:hypothetical protein
VWASALRPILFWGGDTSDLLVTDDQPEPRKKYETPKDGVMGKLREGLVTNAASKGGTIADRGPHSIGTQEKGSDKSFPNRMEV